MNPSEYLTSRIQVIIIDSDRIYNEGARLLANFPMWNYEIERFTHEAWDTILKCCVRSRNASYSAAVKLTFTSNLIGKRICKNIGIPEDNIKSSLSLGDLFLEAFLQEGMIDIYREFDSNKAPYMIRVMNQSDAMKPKLIGTVFSKPEPITGLKSEITGDPYIKGWTDSKQFHTCLDKPFVKALEILRQQPWELNTVVLEAMKANPPPEVMHLTNDDGVVFDWNIHSVPSSYPADLKHFDGSPFLGKKDPRLQRLLSKFFESTQIVRKAEAVLAEGVPFYQEVSCDYRGRIYYAESFLEFQGSDMARSLYLFSNKQVVTEVGYRWLCIHAASCFNQSYTIDELKNISWLETDYVAHLKSEGLETISVDKMTLDDRVKWVKVNAVLVGETAIGHTLHTKAEKPHSFLACCNEIFNYKVADGAYSSGFPIPIDGSNNGWQHLAAISKDEVAGALVSLTPATIQNDFYVAVAKELITIIPEWFAEKNIPMKHIRKGIAKRGAMTRAYSAGKKRIAQNMYDDCHMEGFNVKYNISEQDCDMLAGNLIRAINTVCSGPLKTTKYLQRIAEHELNSGESCMSWTTPSGFPVSYKAYLQHERKQRGTIRGIVGNKDGRIMHVVRVDAINQETGGRVPCRRSFASGISPNFIHSLDAAHMANTIVSFGGSFAAVHDSFSAHADDVGFLQDVTKMTFIAQYDVENFFDIVQDMLMKHNETFQPEQPELGKLNVNDVTSSDYFFC